MKVLITGGTSTLGRALVRSVLAAGHAARAMSRRPRAGSTPANVEWAPADVASGEGLRSALDGVDAVLHAASDPRRAEAVDVTGTQHLVDAILAQVARVPVVMPLPADFKIQSVDESKVADRLVACLADGPRGRVADFGGPEVLTLGEMAEVWMRARGVRKRLVRVPIPDAAAASLRAGKATAPHGERGRVAWREWLERQSALAAA